jgi:hypothetical protein
MCFRNSGRVSSGDARMKATSDARSSRLFWIGVPVRHQRNFEDSLDTAWKSFVVMQRIMCAALISPKRISLKA